MRSANVSSTYEGIRLSSVSGKRRRHGVVIGVFREMRKIVEVLRQDDERAGSIRLVNGRLVVGVGVVGGRRFGR